MVKWSLKWFLYHKTFLNLHSYLLWDLLAEWHAFSVTKKGWCVTCLPAPPDLWTLFSLKNTLALLLAFWDEIKVLVVQLCLMLCNSMDCSLPGSSAHGILQARILEWVVIPFSKGPSPSRDATQESCIAGGFFTVWATREAPPSGKYQVKEMSLFACRQQAEPPHTHTKQKQPGIQKTPTLCRLYASGDWHTLSDNPRVTS